MWWEPIRRGKVTPDEVRRRQGPESSAEVMVRRLRFMSSAVRVDLIWAGKA